MFCELKTVRGDIALTTDTESPLGHDIDSATKHTGLGKTSLFMALKDGRLKARKFGRKLVFLDTDLRAFLDSLPPARTNAASK
jgi:hypothetical protein